MASRFAQFPLITQSRPLKSLSNQPVSGIAWFFAAALSVNFLLLGKEVCGDEVHAARSSEAQSARHTLVDGFKGHGYGPLMPAVGPTAEYHYVREAVPDHGSWAISTFDTSTDSQVAWRVIAGDSPDGPALSYQSKRWRKSWHPMVIAGDRSWSDYEVTADLAPATKIGRCGVTVRTRHDRRYFFVGWQDERAVITHVNHDVAFREINQEVLDQRDSPRPTDRPTRLTVLVVGDQITARLGDTELRADASAEPVGGVGLTTDEPAVFDDVMVQCTAAEAGQMAARRNAKAASAQVVAQTLPAPRLARKISLKDFGADRNIRFGDLDGDGKIDLLIGQILHHGPRDSNSELSCLTAVSLDGDVMWQMGEPDRYRNHLTNDVGFQVHDFDGDGACEVVYCRNQTIHIADGKTGRTLRSAPTPVNPATTSPANKFPRILGDAIAVADLRGVGRPTDLLIKDRYQGLWAMTDTFEPLWSVRLNTGHFPVPMDIDNDGRDEVFVGYTMVGPDGNVVWSRQEELQDHADAIAVADLAGDGDPEVLWAASDEGLVVTSTQGIPRVHHRVGHAQNMTIAELRADVPGLEVAVINFWRSQGILHIFNANGQLLTDAEPRPEHGSTLPPVNWSGGPEELLLLNPDPVHGGLYDGHGRRVMTFPADGHPTLAYDAIDLLGDGRDEIVVWDQRELWVYTQDDSASSVILRNRNARYNESNYRARVSVPERRPDRQGVGTQLNGGLGRTRLPDGDNPLRVLTIGNSFTCNATEYFDDLAAAADFPLTLEKIIIGGASLQRHADRLVAGTKSPDGPQHGPPTAEMLASQPWDVVTIQQVSTQSFNPQTYQPHANILAEAVERLAPTAQLRLHQTWAYRIDDPWFINRSDSNVVNASPASPSARPTSAAEMHARLSANYEAISGQLDAPLIPVGEAFAVAASDPQWGYQFDATFEPEAATYPALPNQSRSLHIGWRWKRGTDGKRALAIDGHHASTAGEYLGACVWFESVLNRDVRDNPFVPKSLDPEFAAFLRRTAHEVVESSASITHSKSSTVR